MAGCEPQGRFGDFLPLPLPCLEEVILEGSSCGTQLPHGRRCAILEGARGTVAAINVLGGHCDEARWPRTSKNLHQVSALRRIMKLHADERESPEKRSDVASNKKLLIFTGVGYTTTPGGLARFDSGELSVPTDQTEALDPAPWMAQELRHFLADPIGEMMLDETERGQSSTLLISRACTLTRRSRTSARTPVFS